MLYQMINPAETLKIVNEIQRRMESSFWDQSSHQVWDQVKSSHQVWDQVKMSILARENVPGGVPDYLKKEFPDSFAA
jgi:hypothetical protein